MYGTYLVFASRAVKYGTGTDAVSVSDPDSLSPDPDPAFLAEYRSGSGPIRIQGFYDQKLREITAANKKFDIFLLKNCKLLILRPP
jgi:hypothetical protein